MATYNPYNLASSAVGRHSNSNLNPFLNPGGGRHTSGTPAPAGAFNFTGAPIATGGIGDGGGTAATIPTAATKPAVSASPPIAASTPTTLGGAVDGGGTMGGGGMAASNLPAANYGTWSTPGGQSSANTGSLPGGLSTADAIRQNAATIASGTLTPNYSGDGAGGQWVNGQFYMANDYLANNTPENLASSAQAMSTMRNGSFGNWSRQADGSWVNSQTGEVTWNTVQS